jgi:glycine hydroxymethyltransferase
VDDLYLYRLERQKFMIVSNASNTERVRDWIAAVNSRRFAIDNDMPDKEADGPVHIRDLRNAGEDSRVGLALQGPLSLSLLQRLTPNAAERAALGRLQMNGFAHATIGGIRCLVARTGYTGEKLGFEIYVHPQEAEEFWTTILETGKPLGVLPAGLGARDSTRVEAGLPLFGHELEGDLGLPLTEAGYGFVVRFHVPFFIGRSAYMGRVRRSRRHVIRLQGQGRKTLRAGHVILDEFGKAVGQVTSFAYAHGDMTYYVLACVAESFRPAPGQKVRGVRLTADKFTGQAEEQAVVELTALTRFPDECERNGWAARYV